MGYSITPVIHPHKDKQGKCKVQIRVTYKRARVYLQTEVKVFPGTPSEKIESFLRRKMSDAEDKMLTALREPLSVAQFKKLFKEEKARSVKVVAYFEKVLDSLEGKLAPGTIRQRRVTIRKLDPETTFETLSLADFEKRMREDGLDGNTISTNFTRLKTMLRIAASEGLIKKESFEGYKSPPYVQKLVDYLTEKEIADLSEVVFSVKQKSKRLAGFYFLLSCYTGWRIGDAKKFKPGVVKDGLITIRTTKNKKIVSLPVYKRLADVIKFCNKNPFDLSEEKARIYVKELCKLAGIMWNVKFHTGRHSFAMLLKANGFENDEVAELIGDSLLITKVYAKVHNPSLHKKIRERLG